jgi:hypothetical protein
VQTRRHRFATRVRDARTEEGTVSDVARIGRAQFEVSLAVHELDRCVVFVGSQVLLDGYVKSYDDGVMRVESEDPLRGPVEPGNELSALIFDEVRGECHFWARVGQVRARGIDLVGVEIVQTVQKRGVARVRTLLPCIGELEPLPESAEVLAKRRASEQQEADLDLPALEAIAFTVLDVSAHGMQVQSRVKLAPGRRFGFVFEHARIPLALTAEVIRVQESLTGYRYGCRFIDQRERSAEELFRFVMQQQGAQRRNRLLS